MCSTRPEISAVGSQTPYVLPLVYTRLGTNLKINFTCSNSNKPSENKVSQDHKSVIWLKLLIHMEMINEKLA